MRRALLLVLLMCACGLGPAPLPNATAVVGTSHVSVLRGSYCWSSWGHGECADAAGPDVLMRTGHMKPISAPAGAAVDVTFDRSPQKVDVDITWATPPAMPGPIDHSGASFALPSAAGVCVFGITGTWPEGSITFLLAVDIQSDNPG